MTLCEFFRPVPNTSRDDVFQTALRHWVHVDLSFEVIIEWDLPDWLPPDIVRLGS